LHLILCCWFWNFVSSLYIWLICSSA
jgi:hypothetical protein